MLKALCNRFARAVLRTDLQRLRSTLTQQEELIQDLRQQNFRLLGDLSTAKLERPEPEKVQVYGVHQEAMDNVVNKYLAQPILDKECNAEYASWCLGIQWAITVFRRELVHK